MWGSTPFHRTFNLTVWGSTPFHRTFNQCGTVLRFTAPLTGVGQCARSLRLVRIFDRLQLLPLTVGSIYLIGLQEETFAFTIVWTCFAALVEC